MRASSAKAKGRRCAAEVRDLLLSQAPHLKEGDIRVTPSGVTGVDVLLSPRAEEAYPFAIECKNQEALNIWSALTQAEGHSTELTPIVFFRRNRSQLYAALRAEDFVKLATRKSR